MLISKMELLEFNVIFLLFEEAYTFRDYIIIKYSCKLVTVHLM